MKKNLFLLFSILFVLFSCKNDFNTNTSDLIELNISISDNNSRAVSPVFTKEELSGFKLTARNLDEENAEEIVLGSWETFDELSQASIKLGTGRYDFTLTAKISNNLFSGTIENKTINSESYSLSFTLELVSYESFTQGNSDGSFEYTISWEKNTAVKEVWAFWNYKNSSAINKEQLTIKDSAAENYSEAFFTKNDFDCYTNGNSVVVTFKFFYETSNEGVIPNPDYCSTYTDLINLIPDVKSSASKSVEIKNDIHSINYVLNVPDECVSWLKLTAINEKKVYRETETLELPVDNALTDKTEILGWCLKEDLSDTPLKEIEKGKFAEGVTLYAKWKKYTITYQLDTGITIPESEDKPTTFDYFHDVTLPAAEKKWSVFKDWTLPGASDKKKIISAGSYNDNITVTPYFFYCDKATSYTTITDNQDGALILAENKYIKLDTYATLTEEEKENIKQRAIAIVFDCTVNYSRKWFALCIDSMPLPFQGKNTNSKQLEKMNDKYKDNYWDKEFSCQLGNSDIYSIIKSNWGTFNTWFKYINNFNSEAYPDTYIGYDNNDTNKAPHYYKVHGSFDWTYTSANAVVGAFATVSF